MRTSVYQEQIIAKLKQHHLVSLSDLAASVDADFSTLYRNMQNLEEQGLVRRIIVDSKRTLYELTTHAHDHFVCTRCDEIEVIDRIRTNLAGHEVEDVIVRGRCGDCMSSL